jgi:nitric oxide dioxygenase
LESLRCSVENTPLEEADRFICGPADFLRILVTGRVDAGVEQEPSHDEYFGLGHDLMAA